MKAALIALVILLLVFEGKTQTISSQYLREFKVELIGNHVNAQWRTGIDFTCSDVDLFFGSDTNNMNLIYSYPGVCGSNTEEKDYNFIHANPEYGTLFYQLKLGVYGNSTIHIVNKKKIAEYITYPNPAKDYCNLEFSDIHSGKVQLSFYSSTGLLLGEKVSLVRNLIVDTSKFPKGLIFFNAKFSEKGEIIHGRFLKI